MVIYREDRNIALDAMYGRGNGINFIQSSLDLFTFLSQRDRWLLSGKYKKEEKTTNG